MKKADISKQALHRLYLTSDPWRKRRQKYIDSLGGSITCEICKINRGEEVHHQDYSSIDYNVSYRSIGTELDEHLLYLCNECHEAIHNLSTGEHSTEQEDMDEGLRIRREECEEKRIQLEEEKRIKTERHRIEQDKERIKEEERERKKKEAESKKNISVAGGDIGSFVIVDSISGVEYAKDKNHVFCRDKYRKGEWKKICNSDPETFKKVGDNYEDIAFFYSGLLTKKKLYISDQIRLTILLILSACIVFIVCLCIFPITILFFASYFLYPFLVVFISLPEIWQNHGRRYYPNIWWEKLIYPSDK